MFGLKKTRLPATIVGLVYLGQSCFGLAAIALPLYLRTMGWRVGEITLLISVTGFPNAAKLLIGILSDSIPLAGFRRKSYLVLFGLLTCCGWLLLISASPVHIAIWVALLLINTGIAGTDVVADAIAVEHSKKQMSRYYQTIAWGVKAAAGVVIGLLAGWLAAHWSPARVFLLCAVPAAVLAFAANKLRERRHERTTILPKRRIKDAVSIFMKQKYLYFGALLVATQTSSMFALPLFFAMKERLAFSEQFLGVLMTVDSIGTCIASFTFVSIFRRVNSQTLLMLAVLLNSISILMSLFIHDATSAVLVLFIGSFIGRLAFLPLMSAAASLSRHDKLQATLFSALMSIYNFGDFLFGMLGAWLISFIELHWLIVLSALLSLAAFIPANRFRKCTEPNLRFH